MNHKDIKEKARVRILKKNYPLISGPKSGAKGTVIYRCGHYVTVEFDDSFSSGHDGDGNGKEKHCWNFSHVISNYPVLKKIQINVGFGQ